MTRKERERLNTIEAFETLSAITLIGFVLCQGLALFVWVMGRGFDGVFAWQFFATICLGLMHYFREKRRDYESYI